MDQSQNIILIASLFSSQKRSLLFAQAALFPAAAWLSAFF